MNAKLQKRLEELKNKEVSDFSVDLQIDSMATQQIESLINDLADKLDIDVSGKIRYAKRLGMYGIPYQMLNLLGNIILFPATNGDTDKLADNYVIVEQWLTEHDLDSAIFELLKDSRGHTTFLDLNSETLQITEAKSPDYETYKELSKHIFNILNIVVASDTRLNKKVFDSFNKRAELRAKRELKEAIEAIEAIEEVA